VRTALAARRSSNTASTSRASNSHQPGAGGHQETVSGR